MRLLPCLCGILLTASGLPAQTLSLSGNWKIHPGDNSTWKADTLDDRNWQTTYVPAGWETTVLPGYDGFAWYRTTFEIPTHGRKKI